MFCLGLPFKIIESVLFRDFIQELRPSYKVKSATYLRGKLLDDMYEKTKKLTVDKIKDCKGYVLISDGWTDISGHHIVNFIVQIVGEKPFFYKSVDTSQTKQTSQNVADLIVATAKELGTDKWTALLLDNANSMQAAADIIEKDYPTVFCNGCCAHGLNLFIKNLCKRNEIKEILDNCNDIIKTIDNHTRLHHKYHHDIRRELGLVSGFVHTVETRWYTQYVQYGKKCPFE